MMTKNVASKNDLALLSCSLLSFGRKIHKTEKEDRNFKMMLILDHSQAVGWHNESTERIFE